jgi:hypothetical protein
MERFRKFISEAKATVIEITILVATLITAYHFILSELHR